MPLSNERMVEPVEELRKLVKGIRGNPTPAEVHDLRTNTRRLEALAGALPANGGAPQRLLPRRAGAELKRLRKQAGKVRDQDVLLMHASTLQLKGEEECLMQLLAALGVERERQAAQLAREVGKRGSRLRKGLKTVPDKLLALATGNGGGDSEHPLSASATAAAAKLTAALALPKRLTRQNLHAYRLKVKELRYLLQMSDDARGSKFVDDLGEVKDAIGDWHDWAELILIAQKAISHGPGCELIATIRQTTERKFEHALERAKALRKNYLRESRSGKTAGVPSQSALQAAAHLAG